MIKVFEMFYKEHVAPFADAMQEAVFEIVIVLLDVVLTGVLWITVPIWIIPFKIIQRIKDKK